MQRHLGNAASRPGVAGKGDCRFEPMGTIRMFQMLHGSIFRSFFLLSAVPTPAHTIVRHLCVSLFRRHVAGAALFCRGEGRFGRGGWGGLERVLVFSPYLSWHLGRVSQSSRRNSGLASTTITTTTTTITTITTTSITTAATTTSYYYYYYYSSCSSPLPPSPPPPLLLSSLDL